MPTLSRAKPVSKKADMNIHNLILSCFLVILVGIFVSGCSGAQNSAPAAVQNYLQAIIDRNEPAMVNHVCSAWEADARTEFNSFTAVKLTLDNVTCQENGASGGFTLVSCQGTIIASYGAEDLTLELDERTFQVTQEAGEWRVCGYKAP
jgi:hypothetical protein